MLLLLLAETPPDTPPPQDPSNPVITVPPFGLNFSIDAATTVVRASLDPDAKRRRLAVVRNEYVRFIVGFDLTYTLSNRAILRCETLDASADPTIAYRPFTDQEIVVARADGTALFTGRIVSVSERALEEPNFGTVIEVSAVDYSEAAEVSFVDRTFGSDQKAITGVVAGGPAQVWMIEPHGFQTGNTVVIEGVVDASVGVNGTHIITVINEMGFTIPINVAVGGNGGTARSVERLGTIVRWIHANNMAEFGITLDPTFEAAGAGPIIEKIAFSGTVKDALDELQKRTGYVYRFLPIKQFQMFVPGTRDAQFALNSSNVIAGLRNTKARTSFSNNILVSYGSNAVVDKIDVFVGDGVTRVFPLSYPPAISSGIQSPGNVYDVGAAAWRHVGVYGYDTLFEWVYRASDNTLVQLSEWAGQTGWPAIPYGAQFHFRYGVQFPQTIEVAYEQGAGDPNSVSVRGAWTKRVDAPTVFDKEAARQFGVGVLNESVYAPRKLTVSTRAGMVFPGTTISVDLPHRLVTGDEWLVTSTRIREEINGSLGYTYELLEDNKILPGWLSYLKGIRGGSGASSSGGGATSGSSYIPPPAVAGNVGSGTPGKLAMWVSTAALGDSVVSQSGQDVIFAGSIVVNTKIMTASGGDLVLQPDSGYVVPLEPWSTNLGRLERKWLTLHAAELWVETLVAQSTMATIGGRILVTSTSSLVEDLSPTETTIHVKYNNFANGDRVYLETFGQVEFMAITSAASGSDGDYTYTVTRNLDGSGANQWYAGAAVVNTGKAGSGFIDIYSLRGVRSINEAGPTIVGNIRNSSTYNDWSPRWAIGNLNGLYGYTTTVFGAAFGDPAGAWIKIETVNGVRIGHGANVKMTIDTFGNATFAGAITSASGSIAGWNMQQVNDPTFGLVGYLYSGETSVARVGIKSSNASGDIAFYAGNFSESLAPFRVYHDGQLVASNAIISGNITATSGNVLAALAAGSITATKIAGGTITGDKIAGTTITSDKLSVGTLSAISANMGSLTAGSIVVGGSDRIWLNDGNDGWIAVGGSNKGSAPFHVTSSGLLHSNYAEFHGNVNFETSVNFTNGTNMINVTAFAGGGTRFIKCDNNGSLFASL